MIDYSNVCVGPLFIEVNKEEIPAGFPYLGISQMRADAAFRERMMIEELERNEDPNLR